MKRILLVLLFFSSFTFSISCQEKYSPWGIWNDNPLDDRARIVDLSYGSFYQNGFDGVWIVENLQEVLSNKQRIPVFVNLGEFVQIVSYTEVQDGFLFIVREKGWKTNSSDGKVLFEYFDIQIKMVFLSKDKCKFIYLNKEDTNGFKLGNIVWENRIYERIPVIDKPKVLDTK